MFSEQAASRVPSTGLSQEEKPGQNGLGKEDGGDAEVEFPLLRFVPEEIHPHERADAAAGDGHPDERTLRDAPLPPARLPLVNSEDQEGQDIDADEVYEECSQGCQGISQKARGMATRKSLIIN